MRSGHCIFTNPYPSIIVANTTTEQKDFTVRIKISCFYLRISILSFSSSVSAAKKKYENGCFTIPQALLKAHYPFEP